MDYKSTDIDKILSFKSWSAKKKVDTLLQIDCEMYTNLGSESSPKERTTTKQISTRIYRAIKDVNHAIGECLLKAMD